MKLDTFFVGIIDFFAALLPGVVCGALVLLWTKTDIDPGVELLDDVPFASVGILLVGGYLFGQMLNAIGSFALDPVYDLFYDPAHGWLVRNPPQTKTSTSSDKAGDSDNATSADKPNDSDHATSADKPNDSGNATTERIGWRRRIGKAFVEDHTILRKNEVNKQLDDLSHKIPAAGGAYQRARAYLELYMPTAFRSIETLEAEQKLYRSLTVGLVVLVVVAAFAQRPAFSALLACATLLCLLRYIARRRKGVNMTYMYFALRPKPEQSQPAAKP